MAEYIEREAVLKALKIARGYCPCAYDEIKRLPAANVAPIDWISVEDRLPESEKPVLTFVGYPESMVGFITVSTYYCFDKTPHWQWDGLLRDEQRTLFWMPLPQPPKEETP